MILWRFGPKRLSPSFVGEGGNRVPRHRLDAGQDSGREEVKYGRSRSHGYFCVNRRRKLADETIAPVSPLPLIATICRRFCSARASRLVPTAAAKRVPLRLRAALKSL